MTREEKRKEIEEEIRKIDLELGRNIEPQEPFRPADPYLHQVERPAFFIFAPLLFKIFFALFVIAVVVSLITTNDFSFSSCLIFSLIVTTVVRLRLYSSEMDDYRDEKTKNRRSFEQSKRKMEVFHQERKEYEKKLLLYNQRDRKNQKLKDKKEELQALLRDLRTPEEKKRWKDFSNFIQKRGPLPEFTTQLVGYDALPQNKLRSAKRKFSKLNQDKQSKFLNLLKEVQFVQQSNISTSEKRQKIKEILWDSQSATGKLWIGGLLGTFAGLAVFGTGGVGLVGLGGAMGFWGFLAGTAGGVFVSSLIQNFQEKK